VGERRRLAVDTGPLDVVSWPEPNDPSEAGCNPSYVIAGLLGAAAGAAAGAPRVMVCTTCSARFERK
jgi:hypothetical protein